jgi:ATP-binding cassette, subfamily B, bacterial CvaB/MchF/RaxB
MLLPKPISLPSWLHVSVSAPIAASQGLPDILSRFTSIEPIRTVLAEGMITGIIDGVMALATFAMILIYSVQLAFVVLVAFVLYAIVRLCLYRRLRQRSLAVIEAKAQENSTFIETLRTIQSLKLFNREDDREGQWLNRYADVVSTNVRLGRTKIAFSTINEAIFGIENIVSSASGHARGRGVELTVSRFPPPWSVEDPT